MVIDRNLMFNEISEKYLPFIRSIVLKKFRALCSGPDLMNDIINDGIVHFYTYHLEKFKYDETLDKDVIFKKAVTYFLHRITQYYSNTSFYGQKIKNGYYNMVDTSESEYSNRCEDRLLYGSPCSGSVSETALNSGGKMLDEYVSPSITKHNDLMQKQENAIYLEQFTKFINSKEGMNKKTKFNILQFLKTMDAEVFGTNVAYYKKILSGLSSEFCVVNS